MDDIEHRYPQEHARIREAYLEMAQKARYRPAAPSDGFGSVILSESEIADSGRLQKEATEYASSFIKEENTCHYRIGASNFATNRALVYTIEAARLLCGARDKMSVKLLEMAIAEIASESDQD